MIQAPNTTDNNIEVKKAKVRQHNALRLQHFEKKNGIQALYEMTNQIDLKNGEVHVENTMKKIVFALKTWHFGLLPKYNYSFFLQRCQALGNGKLTQAYMAKVRRIHKGIDNWVQQADLNPQTQVLQLNKQHQGTNIVESMNIINSMKDQRFANPNQSIQEDQEKQYLQIIKNMKEKAKKKEQSEDQGVQIQQNLYDGFEDDYQ